MANETAFDKYVPIKKYAFPAGDCGGEIRISIPVYATMDDVHTAMLAMKAIADNWKEKE